MTAVKRAAGARSAAADGDDDFEFVAVHHHLLGKAAARHDFAVALQRNALAGEFQPGDQFGAVEWMVEAASFAVDGYGNHKGRWE
jgi:hypothetical protein